MTTEEELIFRKAVEEAETVADVLRKVGRALVGSNYVWVKLTVARLGLDTSHWKGQAHGRSRPHETRTSKEVLLPESSFGCGIAKKVVLREKLLPYLCESCGNAGEWLGKELVLRLDHRNGVRSDHRLDNLRFLCPNCDSQTSTFCGRNKKASRGRCVDCGDPLIGIKSVRCSHCNLKKLAATPHLRKIKWPSREEIWEEVKASSFVAVARRLGVSDNAVRKYLRARA